MQGGRSASALESAKEAAANLGASSWAGKEKTKAVVQEKTAKARARDPAEKAAADARMEERVRGVEAAKQDAMRRNAAAKEHASAADHHPTPLGAGAAAGGHGDAHVLDRDTEPTAAASDGHAGGVSVGAETGAAVTPGAAAHGAPGLAGAGADGGGPPAGGMAGGRYT